MEKNKVKMEVENERGTSGIFTWALREGLTGVRLSTASQAERRVGANVLRESWSFKSTSMIGVGRGELYSRE